MDSLVFCSALLLAAIYVPVFSSTLSIVNPGVSGWGLILVMSILPLIFGQLVGFFRKVFTEQTFFDHRFRRLNVYAKAAIA